MIAVVAASAGSVSSSAAVIIDSFFYYFSYKLKIDKLCSSCEPVAVGDTVVTRLELEPFAAGACLRTALVSMVSLEVLIGRSLFSYACNFSPPSIWDFAVFFCGKRM